MAALPAPVRALREAALKLERAGDLARAVESHQAALALAPDNPDILADLAHLAARMDLHEVAAPLWDRVLAQDPDRLEAVDGRARALRDLGRYDEAVEVLRPVLLRLPGEARLWNTLGAVVNQQGDSDAAFDFFDEAVRLDPRLATALYHRGGVCFDLGRLEAAAADYAAARRHARNPADRAMIEFAAATLHLTRGDLAQGWDGYEVRLSPDWPGSVAFDAPGRRWTPGAPLAGKRLLVLAEQGLGDEIMFANVLPDVIEALGPAGRLSVAVEPRLVDLFRRSFPSAQVVAHATGRRSGRPHRSAPDIEGPIDLWVPMGSLMRRFRRSLDAFPATPGYLTPDPARIAHWKAWLGEGPPALGVTWRSGKLAGDRRRLYPALAEWRPTLRTAGVRIVNLQYGAEADELAAMAALHGGPLLEPALDLRNDLDDLAALSVALDLVLAVPNATANLAAACGARVGLVGAPTSWPRLGTDAYPWYPQAHGFAAAAFGDWESAMAKAAEAAAAL
jgi:tetratricopeptide (TPR) repeat protein